MTDTAKITWSSADSGDPDCSAEIEIVSVRPDDDKTGTPGGLLGIFLGALGIHRFYPGHAGLGALMLLMSVLSFGLLSGPKGASEAERLDRTR